MGCYFVFNYPRNVQAIFAIGQYGRLLNILFFLEVHRRPVCYQLCGMLIGGFIQDAVTSIRILFGSRGPAVCFHPGWPAEAHSMPACSGSGTAAHLSQGADLHTAQFDLLSAFILFIEFRKCNRQLRNESHEGRRSFERFLNLFFLLFLAVFCCGERESANRTRDERKAPRA